MVCTHTSGSRVERLLLYMPRGCQTWRSLMVQNNKYVAQKTARDARQEMEQLGNTLGSAYKQLHPMQREAIEARAEQLRHLVRSMDPDQVLEAGRRRQRAYMKDSALQAARERERRPLMTGSDMGDNRPLPIAGRPAGPLYAQSEPGRRHGAGFLEVVA